MLVLATLVMTTCYKEPALRVEMDCRICAAMLTMTSVNVARAPTRQHKAHTTGGTPRSQPGVYPCTATTRTATNPTQLRINNAGCWFAEWFAWGACHGGVPASTDDDDDDAAAAVQVVCESETYPRLMSFAHSCATTSVATSDFKAASSFESQIFWMACNASAFVLSEVLLFRTATTLVISDASRPSRLAWRTAAWRCP